MKAIDPHRIDDVLKWLFDQTHISSGDDGPYLIVNGTRFADATRISYLLQPFCNIDTMTGDPNGQVPSPEAASVALRFANRLSLSDDLPVL